MKPRLTSANEIEKELGLRHGAVHAAAQRGEITPIYLPGYKRPKYDRNVVYRAFGVDNDA